MNVEELLEHYILTYDWVKIVDFYDERFEKLNAKDMVDKLNDAESHSLHDKLYAEDSVPKKYMNKKVLCSLKVKGEDYESLYDYDMDDDVDDSDTILIIAIPFQ